VPGRPPLTRSARAAAIVAALTLLSACGGAGPARVTPPRPGPTAAAACARLHAALPETVADSHERRDVEPASRYTAAWGDPPIALLCGAPPPRRPLSGDQLTVDHVAWLVNRQGDVLTWVTIDRAVTVELDVPAGFDDQDAIASDVSAAVARADPPA
jgi:hypothetical protein